MLLPGALHAQGISPVDLQGATINTVNTYTGTFRGETGATGPGRIEVRRQMRVGQDGTISWSFTRKVSAEGAKGTGQHPRADAHLRVRRTHAENHVVTRRRRRPDLHEQPPPGSGGRRWHHQGARRHTPQGRDSGDPTDRLELPGEQIGLGDAHPPPSPGHQGYARLVQEWVASIGLETAKFDTHSLRRTKAVLIYRRTGNLRAVQLLLGHSKIESIVRYLGIEVDDAIEITEKIDI